MFAWLAVPANTRAAAQECLTVEGDRILLGDLATALPAAAMTEPDRAVGFAPRPGVVRTLLFREWAGGTRAPLPGEPDELCVQRISRTLTREELTAAIEAAFAQAGSKPAIEVQEFPKGAVPAGRITFPRANLEVARPHPQTGVVQVIGYIEYGNGTARPLRFPIWVRARIEAEAMSLELTCALAPGEEVTPACVEQKRAGSYPFLHGSAITAAAELAGRTARRRLAPGTLLQSPMFSPRQDVRARQAVDLVVRCGQAQLRLKATSESGGATGELVTVRLADSNRRLRARVTGPGAAEFLVQPAGAASPPAKGI